MIVSAVAHARQIQNTATKLNVDLPEPFTAALDAAHRLSDDTAQYDAAVADLNARAIELLLAGKPPVNDATLQRLATRRVLSQSGIRVAGADHANGLILTAIRDFAHAVSVRDGYADGMSDALLYSDHNLVALCAECNAGLGGRLYRPTVCC